MATSAAPLPEGHCRGRFHFAGHRHLRARLHLPAGSDRRQHGRSELFLAPLTARSKIREVLRGLVATRQVHTISLGHAPHFYVAGTLAGVRGATTVMPVHRCRRRPCFLRSYENEEWSLLGRAQSSPQFFSAPVPPPRAVEPVIERPPQPLEKAPAANIEKAAAANIEKTPAARPRFSHQPTRARDRKPVQKSAARRVARRPIRPIARSSAPRATGSSHHAHGSRWAKTASKNGNGNGNGHSKRLAPHAGKASSNGARFSSNGHSRTGNGSNGLHKAKPPRPELCATATPPATVTSRMEKLPPSPHASRSSRPTLRERALALFREPVRAAS